MKIKVKESRGPWSLTTTLAMAFLGLSVVVLLLSSGLQLFSNVQAQQETIASQQQLIAQDATRTVVGFIQEQFSVLDTAVRLAHPATTSPEEQEPVLESLLGLQPAFRQLVLLNAQDQELARASRLSQAASGQLAERLAGDALAQIKQGTRYISPIYIDELTSEPLVVMAVPATDVFGDFQGTLAVEVNLKFMWDLVDQLKVGETGYAYVVDRQGNLIAFRDIARVLRGENVSQLEVVNRFVRSATTAPTTGASSYSGIEGATVVGSFVPLGTPDWAVVTELPWGEAYQDIIRVALTSIGILLVMAVLTGMLGVYLARRLAVPLVNLTQTATRITGGALELRAEVGGPREVAGLASAFNSMTARLRELVGSLESQVEARTEQLRASAEVGRAAASILDPDQLLREAVNLITDRFGFYYAAVFTLDEAGKFAVLREATGPQQVGRILKERGHKLEVGGQSMVGYVTAQRKPRIALDVGEEAVRFANPLLPDTRSEIALPLVVGDRVVGALDVQSTQPAAFDASSAAVLQSMADQIAIALNNAEQFHRAEQQAKVQAGMVTAVLDVTGQLDRDTLFGKIIQHSMALFGADSVGIWMPVEGEALELMAAVGEVQAQRIGQRLSKGEGLSGKVLDTGRALRVEDYQAWTGHAESFKDASIQAALSVPMIGQGRVVGVLALTRAQVGQPFSVDDERIMQLLAAQAASALTNTDLAEEQRRTLEELDTINRRLTGEAWTKQLERTAGGVQLINYARRGQHTAGPDWLPEVEMAVMSKKPVAWSQREGQSGGSPFQAALAAPIVLRGEVIGALQVGEAGQARAWSTDEMNFIQAVADQVALAVENARLLEQTENRAQRERIITEISSKLFSANDLSGVLRTASEELGRVLRVARVETKVGGDYLKAETENRTADQAASSGSGRTK